MRKGKYEPSLGKTQKLKKPRPPRDKPSVAVGKPIKAPFLGVKR